MRKRFVLLVLWFVSCVAIKAALARDCYIEECATQDLNYCFTTFAQWCQITDGLYRANVYDHTRYSQAVSATWDAWNYPPAGPDNSLLLWSDGIGHSDHDIDYWEINDGSRWWWGLWGATSAPSGGCFVRGSGYIFLNVYYIDGSYSWQIRTALHETGHGIGLDHVCYCPKIMNPCLNCTDSLSRCDGEGAAYLYPWPPFGPAAPHKSVIGFSPTDRMSNAPQMIVDWITVDDLKTMIERSDLIVRGHVVNQRFEVERSYPYDPVLGRTQTPEEAGTTYGRLPLTYATLLIDEVYKNATDDPGVTKPPAERGTTIQIEQVGGEMDGQLILARGDRLLSNGEQTILFLSSSRSTEQRGTDSVRYSIVGGFQGRFEIQDGRILASPGDSNFSKYNGLDFDGFVSQIEALVQ